MSEEKDIRCKPLCNRADALAILSRLREAGHVAYFAGGSVRDLLLGLEPKDYDVATDAPPKRVRELFSNTQAVGAAFGVILVRHRQSVIEVATFRAEGTYLDGRRPSEVHFTTAEEDAKRRDFTINGLFFDPIENRIIDYVGGQEDLAARRLRAIGNPSERFEEDHLRLLRAVRFAARFGFGIEPATAEAIRTHAPLLKRISPERIADELRLMLTPPARETAWKLLWEYDLIDTLFRYMPSANGVHFDPTRSFFLAITPGQTIPFGLALAAGTLCYCYQSQPEKSDIRPLLTREEIQKMVRALRQTLRISNEESDQMQGTLEGTGLLLEDSPLTLAKRKRFLARPTSRLSRDLLDAIAKVGLYADRIAKLRTDMLELEKTEFAPAPFISGDDLTTAGLRPGPAFKRILDEVYDAQLEGLIQSREEAMNLALSKGNQEG